MDRLVYRSLSHRKFSVSRKLLSSSPLVKSVCGIKHSGRNQCSYVGQLTTITPGKYLLCHCLKLTNGSFRAVQMTNVFQRHLQAVTFLISRSEWFQSLFPLNKRCLKDEVVTLFQSSRQSNSDKDKRKDENARTEKLNEELKKKQEELDAEINRFKEEMKKMMNGFQQKDKKENNQKSSSDEEDENEKKKRMIKQAQQNLITFFAITLLLWILTPKNNAAGNADVDKYYISWSEFYQNLLLKGEVKNINLYFQSDGEDVAVIQVHDGAIIKGKTSPRNMYIIKIPKGFNFEERVREVEDQLGMSVKDRVPIKYSYPNSWLQAGVQLFFILGLLFIARRVFLSMFPKPKDGKGGSQNFMDMMSGGMRKAKYTRADVASKSSKANAVSFKDVAGLKEPKVEVIEFISYLTKPEIYKALGAKTPRGALLLGPPGCGKTLLARALANEAQVPFLAMAGSEFVEMVGGVGAARVRDLFKEAREKAPCIIYIDEIDAIGKKRGGSGRGESGGGEDEHTLNQLLVEMDGMGTQEGVIMLAATNRADILDKALLRPGRFDRHIMIDLPTMEEREEIFTVYLEKLKLAQDPSVYARPLSRLTPGMSGADISNICNEAAIHAARDKKLQVDKEDFEYAVERVIAGAEKKTSLLPPLEKKVVAYHESGHALVGWMLKYTDALLRISIVPRTTSALGFAQYLPSDQKLYSQQELFERMCMALGGRAAESLIFNHVSTGAQDDLQRVTKMAYAQISSYGMNERVGHLSFPSDAESQMGTKPFSQKLAATIDEEARLMVQQAFLHTQKVLEENKDKLHKLATTLLEKEVLDYTEIEALIGPPIHGKKHTIEPQGWAGIRQTKL